VLFLAALFRPNVKSEINTEKSGARILGRDGAEALSWDVPPISMEQDAVLSVD
jgi:hypothetical protein